MSKITVTISAYNPITSNESFEAYAANLVERLNEAGIPAYDAGEDLVVHTGLIGVELNPEDETITFTWLDGEDADAVINKAD